MPHQHPSILSRTALFGIIAAIVLSLSACATQRSGRATPVSTGERKNLACEQIALEIEKSEYFLAVPQSRCHDASWHVRDRHPRAFLGPDTSI